ncbi:hypothetical protein J5N97_026087 [Dioscorea zingiberensis]|uniref:RED-like N-terminal domain-containing protein n=1 Tax=Dioscorea zingiberensis TaxID=325984 RepID=A0A9D5C222_9LILI|nr:hypothetical protein J5N97_026087 [Dioscorea zingiberensis]
MDGRLHLLAWERKRVNLMARQIHRVVQKKGSQRKVNTKALMQVCEAKRLLEEAIVLPLWMLEYFQGCIYMCASGNSTALERFVPFFYHPIIAVLGDDNNFNNLLLTAKLVYQWIVKPQSTIKANEMFLPGRMAFIYNMDAGFSHDIPTILNRSKADCPVQEVHILFWEKLSLVYAISTL